MAFSPECSLAWTIACWSMMPLHTLSCLQQKITENKHTHMPHEHKQANNGVHWQCNSIWLSDERI